MSDTLIMIFVRLADDDAASYAVHCDPEDATRASLIVRHEQREHSIVRKQVWSAGWSGSGRRPGPKIRDVLARAGFAKNDYGEWRKQ